VKYGKEGEGGGWNDDCMNRLKSLTMFEAIEAKGEFEFFS
jgi:hypothetical protein